MHDVNLAERREAGDCMNDERDRVLAANEMFYAAIRGSDLETMHSLWSEVHEVAVVHPGWAPIFGYAEVLDSWRRIFAGPEPPELYCDKARVMIFGDVALVVCREHLGDAALVAANTFVREESDWRLVHHQAGPMPEGELPPDQSTLH